MRAVAVPDDLWAAFSRTVHDSGLNLFAITGSPAQAPRYEVRTRKGRPVSVRGRDLTEREMQLLAGMSIGMTNGEIGRQLDIAEDTVKSHARRLFRKLGARDRAHAVAIGYQRGHLGVAS